MIKHSSYLSHLLFSGCNIAVQLSVNSYGMPNKFWFSSTIYIKVCLQHKFIALSAIKNLVNILSLNLHVPTSIICFPNAICSCDFVQYSALLMLLLFSACPVIKQKNFVKAYKERYHFQNVNALIGYMLS